MSTRILFVRHGESEGNLTGCFYDAPEALLTSKGRKQSIEAGRRIEGLLNNQKAGGIYCSPWERAIETCEIALEGEIPNWVASLDYRICERSFAGIIGKKIDHASKDDSNHDFISASDYEKIWTYDSSLSEELNVESLKLLEDRVRSFLDDVSVKHPDESVVVFSHGGIGKMMQAICEEWPSGGRFDKIPFLRNGEVVEWHYK